jgi:oligosaccharide reducing-end xylanase
MPKFPLHQLLLSLTALALLLSSCATPAVPPTASLAPATPTPVSSGSFATGLYRNLFQEYLGKSDAEVQAKVDAAFQQLFYGDDATQRVYYPAGPDMAYIEDIGNQDVRTEGMSYGMMIAVQLDKKPEFDRLWKWAKTYMYQAAGPYQGYFAWHCSTDGQKLDPNPASDGEEWFVTALFIASERWGSGQGIFDYRQQAQAILNTMRSQNGIATAMFDPHYKQVVFVPAGVNATFTDPSYQLPAFYELWARLAGQDNLFWSQAARASRLFFHQAANPTTGLMPDYANFDGTPAANADHKDFRFDAWRTLSNVAVDHAWFAQDPWQVTQSDRVLKFLASQGLNSYPNQYSLTGQPLSGDHSTGLVAMAAVASLAATPAIGKPFVQALWDAQIPFGTWRYYDGMLYLLGLLHVSGKFHA